MPPELFSKAWHLPSSQQFIREIGESLTKGESQIILSPTSAALRLFRQPLLEHLERESGLYVYPLDLSSHDGLTPFDSLIKTFPVLSESKYLEKMVESPELPQVILLENLDNAPTGHIQEWMNTIARWSDGCQSSGSNHSLILQLESVNNNELRFPPKNIRLKYRVLAGFPSSLEIRLLCRMESDEIDSKNQWREYILASLAGNDIRMIDFLWDEVFNPVESIMEALLRYGEENGWNKNKNFYPSNWRPKPAGSGLSLSPNEKSFSFLSGGLTIYTPEYGEEIHPCLLAINKNEQEIIHRIWRAQAALLLPAIDDVRRRICNYFSAKYGEDWAYVDKKIVPSPLELGKLNLYFASLPEFSWEKKHWGYGIYQTWNIRNDLAHYKPIRYEAFCDFWRLSSSVHNMAQN